MKSILSITIASLLMGSITFYPQDSVLALEKNRISASEAQGKAEQSATLDVSSYGIVLSFEEMEEFIEKYWATDDTYLRVGTNAPLGEDAKILFLKVEGQWTSENNGTSLTVMTKNALGKSRIYSFLVEFTKEKPKYSIIRIYPDNTPRKSAAPTIAQTNSSQGALNVVSDRKTVSNTLPDEVSQITNAPPKPRLKEPRSAATQLPIQQPKATLAYESPKNENKLNPPKQTLSTSIKSKPLTQESRQSSKIDLAPSNIASKSSKVELVSPSIAVGSALALVLVNHTQANALVRGLTVAAKTGEVGGKSPVASRMQNVILRLRRGEKLTDASKKESIEWKTVMRLLQLGNYRGQV